MVYDEYMDVCLCPCMCTEARGGQVNYSITLCLVLLKEALTGLKLGAQESPDPLTSASTVLWLRGPHMEFCTDFEDLNSVRAQHVLLASKLLP